MAYEKHTWVTGETIDQEKLNNIEDGIESVDIALEGKQDASTALQIGTTATTAMAGDTALLAIGTTASTAAAGNHNHAVTADATSGLAAAANIQALAEALSARIKALEDAV